MLRSFRCYMFKKKQNNVLVLRPKPFPEPLFLFSCRRQHSVRAFWWFVYFISQMLFRWFNGLFLLIEVVWLFTLFYVTDNLFMIKITLLDTSLGLYTSLNRKMLMGPNSSIGSFWLAVKKRYHSKLSPRQNHEAEVDSALQCLMS